MQFLFYHFRPGTVLLIMVFASSFAMAQSVPIDIDFQKIKNQMIAERQIHVLEPMGVATRELNTKYVAALDRLLQNSAQVMKSDLLAIQEERSRISKGESMPPIDFDGTPAVLNPDSYPGFLPHGFGRLAGAHDAQLVLGCSKVAIARF